MHSVQYAGLLDGVYLNEKRAVGTNYSSGVDRIMVRLSCILYDENADGEIDLSDEAILTEYTDLCLGQIVAEGNATVPETKRAIMVRDLFRTDTLSKPIGIAMDK